MFKFLFLCFLFLACNSSKILNQNNTQKLQGKWQLIEFRGIQIVTPNTLILNIKENNVQFKGICNEIVGEWWEDKKTSIIQFKNLGITDEVCDTVHYDKSIFEMFFQVNNFFIQNDTLSLHKFKTAPLSKWVKINE